MLVKSPPAPEKTIAAPAAAPFRASGWSECWWAGPAQALAYLALCLLALEGVFALAHVGEAEYLMPDRVTGFTLMPDKVITQRLEGFGQFKTNSFGMQNAPVTVAKPAGTVRIAVFGDSYVESLHVARDKNFLQTLERDLSAQLGKPVEVLNFGVSNFSVAQDYLRYRTVAKQFKPDLVIQVFRVEESDKLLPQPSSYLSLVRPVFFVGERGELVYDDTNVRAFFNSSTGKNMVKNGWLRQNSRIWNIAGVISQHVQTLKKDPLGLSKVSHSATNPASSPALAQNKEKFLNCYWYMMDKQLEAFRQECADNGTAFMILRNPMIRPELDQLRTNANETRLLYGTAQRIGAPIFNADSLFKLQYGLKNDGTHFLSGGHFNATMHHWLGTNLASYLASNPALLGAERAQTAQVGK